MVLTVPWLGKRQGAGREPVVFEVLVFEVLVFEVLVFEVLVFEVLVFEVLTAEVPAGRLVVERSGGPAAEVARGGRGVPQPGWAHGGPQRQ